MWKRESFFQFWIFDQRKCKLLIAPLTVIIVGPKAQRGGSLARDNRVTQLTSSLFAASRRRVVLLSFEKMWLFAWFLEMRPSAPTECFHPRFLLPFSECILRHHLAQGNQQPRRTDKSTPTQARDILYKRDVSIKPRKIKKRPDCMILSQIQSKNSKIAMRDLFSSGSGHFNLT